MYIFCHNITYLFISFRTMSGIQPILVDLVDSDDEDNTARSNGAAAAAANPFPTLPPGIRRLDPNRDAVRTKSRFDLTKIGEKKPFFQLVHVSEQEAAKLHWHIKEMGGTCKQSNDEQYNPEGHFLAIGRHGSGGGAARRANKEPTPLFPKVIGYLASGKPVVTSEFIYDCADQKTILDPEPYVAKYTKKSREYVKKLGKPLFSDWSATVILSDPVKRNGFEKVLEAGGAKVQKYINSRYLMSAPPHKLTQLTHVFTEPAMLRNAEFDNFMNSRRRGNWAMGVYSFYYIVKFAVDPENPREQLDYFLIDNPKLLSVLHNPKTNRGRRSQVAGPVRHTPSAAGRIRVGAKVPRVDEVIQIDSSDDDDDESRRHKKPKRVQRKRVVRRIAPVEDVKTEFIDLTGEEAREVDAAAGDDVQIIEPGPARAAEKAAEIVVILSSSEDDAGTSDDDEQTARNRAKKYDNVQFPAPIKIKVEQEEETPMDVDAEKASQETAKDSQSEKVNESMEVSTENVSQETDKNAPSEIGGQTPPSSYDPDMTMDVSTREDTTTATDAQQDNVVDSQETVSQADTSTANGMPESGEEMQVESSSEKVVDSPKAPADELMSQQETVKEAPATTTAVEISDVDRLEKDKTEVEKVAPGAGGDNQNASELGEDTTLNDPEKEKEKEVELEVSQPSQASEATSVAARSGDPETTETSVAASTGEPEKTETSEPEKTETSEPEKTETSKEGAENTAQSEKEENRIPITKSVKDPKSLNHILALYLQRQRDTNECLDIENLKCRTLKYDAKGDESADGSKRQVKSDLMGPKDKGVMGKKERLFFFNIFEQSQEREDEIEEDRLLDNVKNLIIGQHANANLVDCNKYVSPDILSKLLIKYLLNCKSEGDDDDLELREMQEVLARKIHEMFHHLLFLHPPVIPVHRLAYARVFSLKERKQTEKKVTQETCQDMWNFVIHIVRRCRADVNDLGAHLALDLFILVLQKDLEYWWKHKDKPSASVESGSGGRSVEKPLVYILFDSSWMGDQLAPRVREFLRECGEIGSECRNPQLRSLTLKFISFAGLLSSLLDKSKDQLGLAPNTHKQQLAVLLLEEIDGGGDKMAEHKREVGLWWPMMLRPAWLGMCLSAAKLKREGINLGEGNMPDLTVGSLPSVLCMKDAFKKPDSDDDDMQDLERRLASITFDKSLSCYGYHVFQHSLYLCQTESKAKNPYKGMTRKLKRKDLEPDCPAIRLDSKLELPMETVTDSIKFFNSFRREIVAEPDKSVEGLAQMIKLRLAM